ncbi:hypothetical protein ACHAXR_013508 [Thalassiosira sp. AJA248-18]
MFDKKSDSLMNSSRLMNGSRSLFRTKPMRKECLNGNILTEQALEEAPTVASTKSNHTLHSKLKTKMTKPFHSLRKKNSSSATGENSLIVPYTSVPPDRSISKAQDTSDATSMFGVCGQVAFPTSAQPDEDNNGRIESLQKQLRFLQGQIHDLNEELDHVYIEKEDAVSKLDRMIESKKNDGVDHELVPGLEEIRFMLTAEGTETTITQSTVRPFYTKLCSCIGDSSCQDI